MKILYNDGKTHDEGVDDSFKDIFLLQYDALIKEEFQSLLSNADEGVEVGLWLEMNQPQVERADLQWRERPGWAWDYHSDTGFSVGYTPKERIRLVDVCFDGFRRIFGYFPASMG